MSNKSDLLYRMEQARKQVQDQKNVAAALASEPDAEFIVGAKIYGSHVRLEFVPAISSLQARMLSVALMKWADTRDSQSHQPTIELSK